MRPEMRNRASGAGTARGTLLNNGSSDCRLPPHRLQLLTERLHALGAVPAAAVSSSAAMIPARDALQAALRLLDDLLRVLPDDEIREIARNTALLIEEALEGLPGPKVPA